MTAPKLELTARDLIMTYGVSEKYPVYVQVKPLSPDYPKSNGGLRRPLLAFIQFWSSLRRLVG